MHVRIFVRHVTITNSVILVGLKTKVYAYINILISHLKITNSILSIELQKTLYAPIDESCSDQTLVNFCGAPGKNVHTLMSRLQITNSIICVELKKKLCAYSWVIKRLRTLSYLCSSRKHCACILELSTDHELYHFYGAPGCPMCILMSRLSFRIFIISVELQKTLCVYSWVVYRSRTLSHLKLTNSCHLCGAPEKTMRIFLSRLQITNFTICVELLATLRAYWGVL